MSKLGTVRQRRRGASALGAAAILAAAALAGCTSSRPVGLNDYPEDVRQLASVPE